MVDNRSALDSLLASVKSWKPSPTELKVTCLDNEVVMVAVSAARNRWARLRDTLGQLDWARVEGLTKTGSLVGLHDHPDLESLTSQAATELEDIELDKASAATFNMVKLMEMAADRAVDRVGRHHEMVLNSSLRVIEVLSERLVQSEAQNAANVEALHQLLTAAKGDDDAVALGLEAMKLLNGSKKKAPKPNGTQ